LHFISFFFGKNRYFKKSYSFTHLIKGIVLGWALWGVSTFLTRNRLSDCKSDFANLPYLVLLVFHNFPLINYGGGSTILKIKLFLFAVPIETPVATDGDSTGRLFESQANLIK